MKEFKIGGGSPWNCYLFQEPTKTILIFLIHHVMGDGRFICSALLRLTDATPDDRKLRMSDENSNSLAPSPSKISYLQILKNIFVHISPLLIPAKLISNAMKCEPLPVPLKLFRQNQMSFERHLVKSSKMSKQNLKLKAQRIGVPFTVILFDGLTSTLRKYFCKLNVQTPSFMYLSVPLAPPATIPIFHREGQGFTHNM
jgi:hypothetical protein